jgi:hypothetical protein
MRFHSLIYWNEIFILFYWDIKILQRIDGKSNVKNSKLRRLILQRYFRSNCINKIKIKLTKTLIIPFFRRHPIKLLWLIFQFALNSSDQTQILSLEPKVQQIHVVFQNDFKLP